MYAYTSILVSISVATLAVQFLSYLQYKNNMNFCNAVQATSDKEVCQH